jgi:hypothetical protein
VFVVGIPFPAFNDTQVKLKKEFNDSCRARWNARQQSSGAGAAGGGGGGGGGGAALAVPCVIPGHAWYKQQGFRAYNQAIGRCIRNLQVRGSRDCPHRGWALTEIHLRAHSVAMHAPHHPHPRPSHALDAARTGAPFCWSMPASTPRARGRAPTVASSRAGSGAASARGCIPRTRCRRWQRSTRSCGTSRPPVHCAPCSTPPGMPSSPHHGTRRRRRRRLLRCYHVTIDRPPSRVHQHQPTRAADTSHHRRTPRAPTLATVTAQERGYGEAWMPSSSATLHLP